MRRTIRSLTITIIISLFIITPQLFSQQIDPSISAIVSANSTFGFKLFNEIFKQNSDSNIFISPLSISLALSMTYNGAAGETEEAMAKRLELQGTSLEQINQANHRLLDILMNLDKDVQLSLANSLWADNQVRFRENFVSIKKEFYDAEITNLNLSDLSSIHRINGWIKEKTKGEIDKMLTKEDIDAILFVINAVYFKAAWTVGFSKEQTHDRDFTLLNGSKKTVPMMMSRSNRYGYFRGEDFQALELPYGNERVSMYLFLPDEKSSLQAFQKKLNRKSWESWMSGFQKEDVMVVLPRLRLEFEIKLNDVLKELGMGIVFTHQANFTKMCYGSPVIDWVKHKATVDVNEEGTEAAAATVVKMKKGELVRLYFDRPFFCAIRDNVTRLILFMGSIVDF